MNRDLFVVPVSALDLVLVNTQIVFSEINRDYSRPFRDVIPQLIVLCPLPFSRLYVRRKTFQIFFKGLDEHFYRSFLLNFVLRFPHLLPFKPSYFFVEPFF